MNTNFILELVGRYILTGAILWGALIVILMVRLAYKSLKSGDAMNFLDKFIEYEHPSDKERLSRSRAIVRFIIWPYGLCESIHVYMRHELQAIRNSK